MDRLFLISGTYFQFSQLWLGGGRMTVMSIFLVRSSGMRAPFPLLLFFHLWCPGFLFFFFLVVVTIVCLFLTYCLPSPALVSLTFSTKHHWSNFSSYSNFSFLWGSGSHIESLAYVLLYLWVFLNSLCHPAPGLNSFCCCVFLWQFALLLLLSHVQLFVTPWPVACQVPLSSTVSWSLLKFMSLDSVWCYLTISSSATPFSFCLLSFLASRSFPVDLCKNLFQWIFASGGHTVLEHQLQHQSFQWIFRVDFF